MGLAQVIFRPAAQLAATHARLQLRAFQSAHRHTAQVQQRLLERLLACNQGSAFGRDHGLGKVRTYRDFVSALPIADYERQRPYVDRVMAGEVEAMFAPGTELVMFAVTSGTTGNPKHIPVTRRFLSDYRRGWNLFGVRAFDDHPACWLRKILTISSSACERVSPGGLPCGSISGMLSREQKWIVRQMYPVPPAVADIPDAEVKLYAFLRCAIAHDPGMLVTANPSSAIKLAEMAVACAERVIRDVRDGTLTPPGELPASVAGRLRFRPRPAAARRLEEVVRRHGELSPKHFWRLGLLMHWTGGTVGLYLPRVRRFYGDVPIRDIGLLASEGRLSVPLADGTPAGAAEITSNFLEFVPAEQVGSPRPDVLRAHEVEVGGEYFVVLTNWAGLWRYHIDDRVRVTARVGESPVIEFLSRGLHTCSITGEKVTEHQAVQAMRQAVCELGSGPETFVLQGHFADPPYYELFVEPVAGVDLQATALALDRGLRRLNVEYEGKRAGHRLGPIRVRLAERGYFAREGLRQINLRLGRAEQYKHKYLLTEVVKD